MAIRVIATDTQSMQGDINAIRTELDSMRAALRTIYGDVADLDRMWDGLANAAFNRMFARDQAAFDEFCNNLEALTAGMENARQEYARCEDDVASAIAAIRIG